MASASAGSQDAEDAALSTPRSPRRSKSKKAKKKDFRRERLLFVCTFNISRSVTAQSLFDDSVRYEARSAGTHSSAQVPASAELITWADRVVVMEEHHAVTLRERFPEAIAEKVLMCLGIPDEYQPMEEALVLILRERLGGALEMGDVRSEEEGVRSEK
jgi:predicted protein tyrosine phosphatase